jgi:hypothetical protein
VAVPAPHEPAAPVTKRGVLPTAKLLSAAGTMLVLYLLRLVVDVDEDLEQVVNLIVPLIVAYFVPNAPTPGGVPDAEVRSWRPRGEAGYGVVEAILIVFLVLVVLVVLFRLL